MHLIKYDYLVTNTLLQKKVTNTKNNFKSILSYICLILPLLYINKISSIIKIYKVVIYIFMINILINKIDGDHEIVLKVFISRFSFFFYKI